MGKHYEIKAVNNTTGEVNTMNVSAITVLGAVAVMSKEHGYWFTKGEYGLDIAESFRGELLAEYTTTLTIAVDWKHTRIEEKP